MKMGLTPNQAMGFEVAYWTPACSVDKTRETVHIVAVGKSYTSNWSGVWGVHELVMTRQNYIDGGWLSSLPAEYPGQAIWNVDVALEMLAQAPSSATRNGHMVKQEVMKINKLNNLLLVALHQKKAYLRKGMEPLGEWLFTQHYGVFNTPIEDVRQHELWPYAVRLPDAEALEGFVGIDWQSVKHELFAEASRWELMAQEKKACEFFCIASAPSWSCEELPRAYAFDCMTEAMKEAVTPKAPEPLKAVPKAKATAKEKAELLNVLKS